MTNGLPSNNTYFLINIETGIADFKDRKLALKFMDVSSNFSRRIKILGNIYWLVYSLYMWYIDEIQVLNRIEINGYYYRGCYWKFHALVYYQLIIQLIVQYKDTRGLSIYSFLWLVLISSYITSTHHRALHGSK